jgi:hypothetical protein
MSTTQSRTTATSNDIDRGLPTPPSLPPVLPLSPPIITTAASSAPSLPGSSEHHGGISSLGNMEGGGTGGSTIAGGASRKGESSLVDAGNGTTKGPERSAGIKSSKPKAGLHVSVSVTLRGLTKH